MKMLPLRMPWQERKSIANDLIAFMAAFGVSRADAENCLSIASGEIRHMSAADYIKTGEGMNAFNQLMHSKETKQ